jgi:hypothetical protein
LVEVEADRSRIKVALIIGLVIQPDRCCVYDIRGNHKLYHELFILLQDVGRHSQIGTIRSQLCDLLNILLVVPLVYDPQVGELGGPSS